MSEGQIHLAVLGCGAIARRHARTIRRVAPGVKLSFASRDGARAERYARTFGGGALAGYDAALSSPDVDAVLILTPPAKHAELACRALEAGKHVIVEKPAFPGLEDFAAVRAAAGAAGRRVMVAENYRYKPLTRLLRRLLAAGAVGTPLLVEVNALKLQRPTGWRADRAMVGGGALLEGGIHWVDFMCALGLEPADVVGRRAGLGPPTDVAETVAALIRYREGAVGVLAFSWEVPTRAAGVQLSRIAGTEGSIRFESNGLFVWLRGRRTRLYLPGLRDLGGFGAMWRDFAGALLHDRDPEMTLDEGERDVRLVHEIYRTAAAAARHGTSINDES